MKRFSLTFSVAAVLLLSIYLFYPQQKQASANITDIEQLVPALMKEAAIPGLAIAKIEFGEIAYTGTFGFANLATGQRVTNNTLFNIASISKPIMGLTLLQLADEGKVNLDEEINQYLSFNIDNPHVNNEAITLRHLASHSSGIADYYDIESYSINADPAVSLKEHISNLLLKEGSQYDKGAHYLNQLPGEYRQYSNLGAALAGQIVEEVTGYPLAEYSKMSLFTSLNMPSTSWLLNDLDLAEIATPYEVEQCIPWLFICANSEDVELNHLINKYITPPDTYKSFLPYPHFGNPQYPDGGMRTNIIELSRFVKHMLANKDAD